TARTSGAERAAVAARRAADGAVRPLADDRRAREGGRFRGGGGARGARVRTRVFVLVALLRRVAGGRRGARSARVDRDGGAPVRGVRGPRRPRAGLSRPRRARAPDPAPALLQGSDAVADRAAGRDLADARLAPDPALAGEDPRRDRGRGGDEELLRRTLAGGNEVARGEHGLHARP